MDTNSNQLNWRCHLDPSEESRPERALGRDAPADLLPGGPAPPGVSVPGPGASPGSPRPTGSAAEGDAWPWVIRPADWFLRQLGLPWPSAQATRTTLATRPGQSRRTAPAGPGRRKAARGHRIRPSRGKRTPRWPRISLAGTCRSKGGPTRESHGRRPSGGMTGNHRATPGPLTAGLDRPPIWPRPPGLVVPAGPGDAERTPAGDTLLLARRAPGGSGQPGRRRSIAAAPAAR